MFLAERPALSGARYDLADFVNQTAIERQFGVREDAATAGFFLRDLTAIQGKTYDVKYPDLLIRQLVPVFTGVDPGAESYVWRQYDRVGAAHVIHDYAADAPSSEVVSKEFQSRIFSLGTSYNYSLQDLRKSAMAGGIGLDARKALTARRAMENAVEQLGWFGAKVNPGTGAAQALLGMPTSQSTNDAMAVYGLANFPGLTVSTTTNDWTAPGTAVATIVKDFSKMFTDVISATLNVHKPDTVVFPLSIWLALAGTARSTAFTEDSVLQYLLKVNPWVKNVFYTDMLETAGLKQDTTTPGPRILCFERNNENVEMVVPQEFEQLPPQAVNMVYKTLCHMRFGGLRISYPKAFIALDGAAG